MKRPNAKTAGLAGAGMAGVIVAGALLALATPTAMKQTFGDDDAVGQAPAIVDDTAQAIALEVPPQDLAPDPGSQAWAAPQSYYAPVQQAEAWVEPVPDYAADLAYADDPAPARLIEASADGAAAEADDAAAASAEAAQAAAADVRAVENAASDEATPADREPKAASKTS